MQYNSYISKKEKAIKNLEKLSLFSLLLSIFFLPIDLNKNNIFLVVFFITQFFLFFLDNFKRKIDLLKQNKKQIFLYTLPFWLTAFGLLYTEELNKGLNFVIRILPLLLTPIFAVLNPKIFYHNYKKMGYILFISCLFVAFWSWYYVFETILSKGQPIKNIFSPLYSHHNLVKHTGVHPAYLSIFIYTAIGFIIIQLKKVSNQLKLVLIFFSIILFFFMLHLLSRTAILYFLIALFFYLIYIKQWKIILGGLIVITTLGYFAYNMNNNYLRDRLFKSLNFFEKETQFSRKDDRFDRLSASYEIFKEKPLIGYGTAGEDKYRRIVFKRNEDIVAYNRNYNAHNQFFEYLSTYGILGGIIYVLFFGYLFYVVFKIKNYYLLFLLTGLFIGCVTESILERSIGVVFTSLLVAYIISFRQKKMEC